MTKKTYQQPTTSVVGTVCTQLLSNSEKGWSQDGEPVIEVGKENEVGGDDLVNDSIGGYGGFLDLD